jgi:hypothetical protein
MCIVYLVIYSSRPDLFDTRFNINVARSCFSNLFFIETGEGGATDYLLKTTVYVQRSH